MTFFRAVLIWPLLALGVTACERLPPEAANTPRPPAQTASPLQPGHDSAVDLLESRVERAIAGDPRWGYVRRAKADFDGDGRDETAVLIADVELGTEGGVRGELLWDHGHRWQLYIEEADSTRTYVYARFLPNGRLEASVTIPGVEKVPTIVLRETTPYAIGIYEVRYLGPQRARSSRHVYRELDRGKYFEGSPGP